MNTKYIFKLSLVTILSFVCTSSYAQIETSGNPFISHDRGADPSAQVWNDGKVWVYASHDQDDATSYASMDGYRVYSSYDMVNWTDHGEILHSRDVSWGTPDGGKMFAPDAAYKDGKYYLYFPHPDEGWSFKVGVAISDKPEGPFIDIGNYIEGTDGIDPTCFIDDDGTAYLMWGGDHQPPRIAKLKENMIELAEEPRIIEYGRNDQKEFFEAGYIHKYSGKYYFSYNCNTCWPETGQYAIGDHPYGPYEYKGAVSDVPDGAQIHNSMIEYHGQWYYFYHMGSYNNGSMYRRNLCVDSMFYNTDGTIKKVVHTEAGVGLDLIGSTTGHIIPGKFEAGDYFSVSNIGTTEISDSVFLIDINNGDKVDYVLDILGTEDYELKLGVSDVEIGTNIYCFVNNIITDTIIVNEVSNVLTQTVSLYKGKHTIAFEFENNQTSSSLLTLKWIELEGSINYHSIEASANTGGSISPEGTVYVANGDSVTFYLDWEIGYAPDSLLVNGNKLAQQDSYTFRNVTSSQSIQANFVQCAGTELSPNYIVNNANAINASEIEVTEGGDLTLYVEYGAEGELVWVDPFGYETKGDRFKLDFLKLTQSGTYSAIFTNLQGCKSKQDFQLTVKPIVLHVYQAEDYIDQSGIQNEGCADLGGGENVGFIENNDWCTYEITVDTVGVYKFFARAATGGSGGSIEISSNNKVLGSLKIEGNKSSGWQDWYTTEAIELNFPEKGKHVIKLTFKGGGGYLFNINWFDVNYTRPISVKKNDYSIGVSLFPNPTKGKISINARFNIEEIEVFNIQGKKELFLTPNKNNVQLKIDLPTGVYLVKIKGNGESHLRRLTIK